MDQGSDRAVRQHSLQTSGASAHVVLLGMQILSVEVSIAGTISQGGHAIKKNKVTAAQLRVMVAVMRLYYQLGYPPSVREIAAQCGVAVSGVNLLLHKLRVKGLVSFVGGRNGRTLVPLYKIKSYRTVGRKHAAG